MFTVDWDELELADFPVEADWPRIAGAVAGDDVPTCAVDLAHDATSDTVYVVSCFAPARQQPGAVLPGLVSWARGISVAWLGHAGLEEAYRRLRLNIARVSDHYPHADIDIGLKRMSTGMERGALRVMRSNLEWRAAFERARGEAVPAGLIRATALAVLLLHLAKPRIARPHRRILSGEAHELGWMAI